jgi:hypothetical protein
VSADGEVLYRPEEITAITYGSDNVARSLGVETDLPCIAILNAIPTGKVDILKLKNDDVTDVISLLRELVRNFNRQERYRRFLDLIQSIHDSHVRIDALGGQRCQAQRQLLEVVKALRPAALWVDEAIAELSRTRSRLDHLAENPDVNTTERLSGLIEKHVRPYLGYVEQLEIDEMQSRLHAVRQEFEDAFVREVLDTPAVQDIRARFEAAVAASQIPLKRQLSNIELQLDAERQNLDRYEQETTCCEIPDLQHEFRILAAKKGISVGGRKASKSTLAWIAGFLKPETLVKIGELLAKHYG